MEFSDVKDKVKETMTNVTTSIKQAYDSITPEDAEKAMVVGGFALFALHEVGYFIRSVKMR